MKNNALNYKLLNILIIVVIAFLAYQMKTLWLTIIGKILTIIFPFFLAFTIAYVLYPISKKLQSFKIPKFLALAIIYIALIAFIVLIFWLFIPSVLPLLFEQTTSLFNAIIKFIQDVSSKFDVNLATLKESISGVANYMTVNLGKAVSDGVLGVINQSINIFTISIIALVTSAYFLSDMENIRRGIKNYLLKRNRRTYNYVKALDEAVYQYFNGLSIYIFIQLFEYTIVFYVIGHPYYLLFGILAAITTIIPYFGALITNILAVITASVISTKLLILTAIALVIFPNIDGYIISPKIFKQTNKIPALLTIFAVFAGGIFYGFVGIAMSLPLTIILLTTYRFYRNDINHKLGEMKRKKKS